MKYKQSFIIVKHNKPESYYLYEKEENGKYKECGFVKDISILPPEHPISEAISKGKYLEHIPGTNESNLLNYSVEMYYDEIFPYVQFTTYVHYSLVDIGIEKIDVFFHIPEGIDTYLVDSLRAFGISEITADVRIPTNIVVEALQCIRWSLFEICNLFKVCPHEAGLRGCLTVINLSLWEGETDGRATTLSKGGAIDMLCCTNECEFNDENFVTTFFHEWSHLFNSYLDILTRDFDNPKQGRYTMTDCGENIPDFCKDFIKSFLFTKSGNKTNYYKEVTKIDKTEFGGKGYWNDPNEIFARLIEDQLGARHNIPCSEGFNAYKKTAKFIEDLASHGIFPTHNISIEQYFEINKNNQIEFMNDLEFAAKSSSLLNENGTFDEEKPFSFSLVFGKEHDYLNHNKFYVSGIDDFDFPVQVIRVVAFLYVYNMLFKDIMSVEILEADAKYNGFESTELVQKTLEEMLERAGYEESE